MAAVRRVSVITVLGFALAALPALAGSHTWSGATNGNWSVGTNWSAGGAPTNGESSVQLDFPNAQGNMASMVNDLTGLNVTSITFHDTAYHVTGNAINLAGMVSVDNGTMYSAARIDFDIALTGDATFQNSGNPDYHLDIHGAISGPHNVTVQMAPPATGTPLVQFFGANTYTGTTTVSSSYLELDNPSALGGTGTGTTVQPGGTLKVYNVVVTGEGLSIGGAGQNGNGALQVYGSTWAGPVALTSPATIVANSGATISGPISGAFPITFVVFSSALTLTQNNTYAGPSTINFGTVIVDGNQPASAWLLGGFSSPGTVLGGSGTVGAVSPDVGGNPKVVDPGPAGGTGILSTGNFSLNDTASGNHTALHVDLNGTTAGTQYDQVNVTGTVDVTGAALQVALGYAPALSDTFVIVNNDGADAVTGTFAGLAQGATFAAGGRTFQISYTGGTGNDITLTVTSLTPVSLQRFAAE